MTDAGAGNPQEMIKGPATGLMVVGGIGIALGLLGLAMNALTLVTGGGGNLPPELASQVRIQAIGGLVGGVIGLAVSAFLIYGSTKMKTLENKSMAMVVAILAMVPCGGCCIIGLPIGIWALMTMNKPEFEGAWKA